MLKKPNFKLKPMAAVAFSMCLPFNITFAASSSFTVQVPSGSPVTIPVNNIKAGTQISITAVLSSSDPNENGEGEPLFVTTSNGTFTDPIYVQPYVYNYTAQSSSETITASISGSDSDESATLTIAIGQIPRFTPEEKAALAKASNDWGMLGSGQAGIAAACALVPDPTISKACAVGYGVSAGLSGFMWAYLGKLSLDPADSNYTVIAQPVPLTFTRLSILEGFTQPEADAFNTLFTNEATVIGLSDAIITSINRAQGANDAGDSAWEVKQMAAAANYGWQLSQLLDAEPVLMNTLKNTLQAAGFPNITLSTNNVYQLEYQASSGQLPLPLTDAFTRLGANASFVDLIRQMIVVQDPTLVAGTAFDKLTDSSVYADFHSAASALASFAITQALPLQIGQGIKAEGELNSDQKIPVQFELETTAAKAVNGDNGLHGEFHFYDPNNGFKIVKSSYTRAVALGNIGVVDGTYTANDGSQGTFRVTAISNKALEKLDSVNISLSNGYNISTDLTEGQVILTGLKK